MTTTRPHRWRWLLCWWLALSAGLAVAFDDADGCLVCHKYPLMGRVTDTGERISYFIDADAFAYTVHRNVRCRDCHKEISQLPHEPVVDGVRCESECHSVENPSTGENFSHKAIVGAYSKSSHGREKRAAAGDADKPYCTHCHANTPYDPAERQPPAVITDRCVVCHEDRAFADNWYKHTSRRIREVRRQPQQIVALCSGCHGDPALIERSQKAAGTEGRQLGPRFAEAVASYDRTLHAKVTRFGLKQAATCLDCHATKENYYLSVHNIRPSRDPESPVHTERRVATCKQCHTSADADYAQLDPHPTLERRQSGALGAIETVHDLVGDTALYGLIGLAALETFGRRRDGAGWRLRNGSSWHRAGRRGRRRLEPPSEGQDS